jgi:DNA polymerase-3 subunit epsilon
MIPIEHERLIFADVETTGFHAASGDRIVEIGLVEMIDRRLTGRVFHKYINPERSVPAEAAAVHGLDDAFLSDKPKFRDIVQELQDFIRGSWIIIHNGPFDIGFVNMELARVGVEGLENFVHGLHDTLQVSRREGLAKKHSLNDLCKKYRVNLSGRKFHGALLDSSLLADVYVRMTEGQEALIDDVILDSQTVSQAAITTAVLKIAVSADETLAHEEYLSQLAKANGGRVPLWKSTTH